MRDLPLYASGTLGLAAAFVHGLLGETRVFARARIEPERLRLLIRGVWHCSAVAWAGVAVLLIAAPWMGSQMARHWIVGTAAVIYGFSAIVNAWVLRGRHFGWILLAIIVALALAKRACTASRTSRPDVWSPWKSLAILAACKSERPVPSNM